MKISTRIANVRSELRPTDTSARPDKHPHPRPRVGKTRREWADNPNKETDRKSRQWANAVASHKWQGSLRHKA